MSEPSVLTYARHFGLTAGSDNVNPLSYLQILPMYQQSCISTIRDDEGSQKLLRTFEKLAEGQMSLPSAAPDLVHSDPINYLQSCRYQPKDFLNPEDMYRQLRRAAWSSDLQRLKVEETLLMVESDVEDDVCEIHRARDPGVRLDHLHSKFDVTVLKEIKQPLSSRPPLSEAPSDAEHGFGEGIQREALYVTAEALDYLKAISTPCLDADATYRLAKENLPLRQGLTLLAPQPLADDDLYFSSDDEGTIDEPMPAVADNLEGSLSIFEDEAELLAHLDASTVPQNHDKETLLSDGTQLDDLFEQFNNHNKPEVFDSGNSFHFMPPNDSVCNPAKQPEQKHTPFQGRGHVKAMPSELRNQASDHRPPTDTRLSLPQLLLMKPSLPTIEVSSLIARATSSVRDMSLDNTLLFRNSADLSLLPFPVTSMEDLMPCLEPLNTTILDKLHLAPNKVIEVEKLLWREPGLRILDRQDDDDEELVAEEYEIDESMNTPFFEAEIVNYPNTKTQYLHGEAANIINASKVEHLPSAKPQHKEQFQTHPNTFNDTLGGKKAFQDTVTSAHPQIYKRKLSEGGENDSFIRNSLSSFLDFRGKRFKLLPGARNREGRDIKDDPIQATQEGRVDDVVEARDPQDPKEVTEQQI